MRSVTGKQNSGLGYSILEPSGNSNGSMNSEGFMHTKTNEEGVESTTMQNKLTRHSTRRKKSSIASRMGYHPHKWTTDKWKDEVSKSIEMQQFGDTGKDEEMLSHEILEQLEQLKQVGCNQEAITLMVYEHHQNHKLPNFLAHLHLDEDGGLDRIKSLYSHQKIFWAFLLFAFVFMNVYYLLASNWTVFNGFMNHFIRTQTSSLQEILTDILHGDFSHLERTMHNDAVDGMQEAAVKSGEADSSDIYSHIPNAKRRNLILMTAGIAGTCEVVWVLVFILYIFYDIGLFLCSRHEYIQFTSILHVFQDSLPLLSTFSLMKFMSAVHPALIYNMMLDYTNNARCCNCLPQLRTGITIVWFVITRILLASLALFAFSMKLLSVGLKLIDPHHGFTACLFAVFGFMNQCMGCVLFERVLQDRIFLFIFGGSDTDFCEDELALKAVYRCRMAKQIWDDFWMQGDRFKAIVMFATLDHYDIQRLLINEPDEHVARTSIKSRTSLQGDDSLQMNNSALSLHQSQSSARSKGE